ncbi:MAG TPA: hypothetical protein VFI89_09845 [Burkholderiales bacterium]|nr:hypothetical protein [Burkholderiales bacterium]
MISGSILLSALALAVAAFGAVALIILSTRVRTLESLQSTNASSLRALAAKLVDVTRNVSELKSMAPTALAAEVGALNVAVGKLADTQRRMQGRFDAFRQHEAPAVSNGDTGDDELSALLALQSAPKPGA